MLKLIHAPEMNIESATDFYNSYTPGDRPLAGYELAVYGEEKYLEYVSSDYTKHYYLVDSDNEDYILGYCTLNDDNCRGWNDVGNISYDVRPTERRKRYGSAMLELLLDVCCEEGRKWVCVSSEKGNVASQKIIESHGGIFEKEFYDDFEGAGLKYWIKVRPKVPNRAKRLVKLFKKEMERYKY